MTERFWSLHAVAYKCVFSAWSLQVCRQRRTSNRGDDLVTVENLSDQHVAAEAFATWLMVSRIAGCRNRHLLDMCRLRHRVAMLRCERRECAYVHVTFSNWKCEVTKSLLEFRILQIWDLLHSCRVIASESRLRLVQRLWFSELCMLVHMALMFWRRCLEDSNNSVSCSHLRFVISALEQGTVSQNHSGLLEPAL